MEWISRIYKVKKAKYKRISIIRYPVWKKKEIKVYTCICSFAQEETQGE